MSGSGGASGPAGPGPGTCALAITSAEAPVSRRASTRTIFDVFVTLAKRVPLYYNPDLKIAGRCMPSLPRWQVRSYRALAEKSSYLLLNMFAVEGPARGQGSPVHSRQILVRSAAKASYCPQHHDKSLVHA